MFFKAALTYAAQMSEPFPLAVRLRHKGKIGGGVNVRKTTVAVKLPRGGVGCLTMP
ncbi:hypothetical protein [Afipia felis]|uniref:hypothetical protein n=1 Tax=Afipia felis TaxID=1035 RepID=UPI001AEBBB3C|nr:hypothetical protein [Afipia felis]